MKKHLFILFLCCPVLLIGQHTFPPYKNVTFRSSDIPVIVINTGGKLLYSKSADRRICCEIKVIDNEKGARNNISDLYTFEGYAGIKYRGNSSFSSSDKKPYSIEIWDGYYESEDAANELDVGLLGMNPHADWALLAPFNDKSMIRDVMTFELFRNCFDDFVPQARFCELIFNGQYHGVYILVERIKRGDYRLKIPSNKNKDGQPQEVGYHLEIDRDEEPGFRSDFMIHDIYGQGQDWREKPWYQFKYPKEENITSEQRQFIIKRIHDFEEVMTTDNYNHPELGYKKYIHEKSVIDHIIVQELSRDIDGYRLSTPIYKFADSKDPRFHMSIWDFNIAYGNADYGSGWPTEGFIFNHSVFAAPYWFKRIISDTAFYAELKSTWAEYRKSVLSDDRILHVIDSLTSVLSEASVRNFEAWNKFGTYVWPQYYISQNYTEEIDYLKRWTLKRTAWLDTQWLYDTGNRVVNGGFECDGDYGSRDINSLTLSHWGGYNSNQALIQSPVFSGEWALRQHRRSEISQVITELIPGKYIFRVRCKTEGNPGAYFYIRRHADEEERFDIPDNNGAFTLYEMPVDIENPFCWIVVGSAFPGSKSGASYLDDIELVLEESTNSMQITGLQGNYLYPTYIKKDVTVRLNDTYSAKKASLTLYSPAGNKTLEIEVANDSSIDLSGLQNGIYLYRLSSSDGRLIGHGKLMK